MVIAYVFWYTRESGIEPADFEQGLAAFHEGLTARVPAGFLSSTSSFYGRLPWIDGQDVYEDWYLVDDFASLGELNRDAAAGRHRAAHNAVAAYSGQGVGGLYGLEAGGTGAGGAHAYWFDRPQGTRTPVFLDQVRSLAERHGATLWRRQLSLGPAKEYCLRSSTVLQLPFDTMAPEPVRRVWSRD